MQKKQMLFLPKKVKKATRTGICSTIQYVRRVIYSIFRAYEYIRIRTYQSNGNLLAANESSRRVKDLSCDESKRDARLFCLHHHHYPTLSF